MINISASILSYKNAEEFYSLFMALKNKGANILTSEHITARPMFKYLEENGYIDLKYLKYLDKTLGTYYTGKDNSNAIFDGELIISTIAKREELNGLTKEDIENFFLYHLAVILQKEANSEYGSRSDFRTNLKDYIKSILAPMGEDLIAIKIPMSPIPSDIRNIKLQYYNIEEIKANVSALKDSLKEEKDKEFSVDLINLIIKQLT